MFRIAVACAVSLTAFARAEELAPSGDFLRRATECLKSADSAKRKAAFRSFLQLDKESMPAYDRALGEALRYHADAVDHLSADLAASPYAAHERLVGELARERARVLELIRTDWKKDGSKIAMLREQLTGLTRLHNQVRQAAATRTEKFDQALNGSLDALAEITRERLRFHPDESLADLDDKQLRERC